MENNKNEEKKGKRTFRTILLIAGTVAICYEVFARKGQDVKNAYGWIKDKTQSKQQAAQEPAVENQNRNKNNDWKQQRRN